MKEQSLETIEFELAVLVRHITSIASNKKKLDSRPVCVSFTAPNFRPWFRWS